MPTVSFPFRCTFVFCSLLGLGAVPGARAQNGYELQRAIEHRREFERELDSYRARPNSTLGRGSVVPESEIRAWLDGRKAAENAWRDQEAARREREAAARRERQQADRDRERAIASAIRDWEAQGCVAYDAVGLAYGTVARADGGFARGENYRQAAREVGAALRRFRDGMNNADFAECAQRARVVAKGLPNSDYDWTPVAMATAGRCFEELAERFAADRARALGEAAFFHARAYRERALWSAASTVERRDLLAHWARCAEGSPNASDRDQFAEAAAADLFGELFSPYDRQVAAWLEAAREDRWLRITPHRAGLSLTEADLRMMKQTREFSLGLIALHRQRGDRAAAASACVRLLDYRGWPASAADRASVDAFFVAEPEAVKPLGGRELELLQESSEFLTAPALIRRFVLENTKLAPEVKAARLERAAQAAGDAGLALEAAYLYKGNVWEDYADADGLLRVAQWVLAAPALNAVEHRPARAQIEALGCALLQECSAANLAAARRLAREVPEGRYAEILLLSFGRGRTPEHEREALVRIGEMDTQQRDIKPWDGRLGAPTPRVLRTLVLLPTLKAVEEMTAEIVALDGSRDPWAKAFVAHALLDPRRPEEHWAMGNLYLGLAVQSGIRMAAADLGVLHYFGGCGYTRDAAAALPHLLRGAEAGYGPAIHALGLHYYHGDGGTPNPAKAFSLLSRVTDAPRADAQAKCAQLCLDGRLGTPDPAKALPYARTAAELGDSEGAFLYGGLIARGQAAGQPAAAARAWWEKARAKGHAGAARELYAVKVRGTGAEARKAAVEEFRAFLEEKTPAERFAGALALLDDEPGAERIGFKDTEAGREMVEALMEIRFRPAREYFEKRPW